MIDESQVLKNIFAPGGSRTSYCTIIRRISASRYEVEDRAGRTMFVDSVEFFPPKTEIIVQDGQIVRRGNSSGKHRFYDV